jgi:hypothetical protein
MKGKKTNLPLVGSKLPGELTPDEKWNELKRELLENIKWYREMQTKPNTDWFYFCLRECCVMDILSYMMYLDGKESEETKLLIALLGKPAAYTVSPRAGRNK